jgi:hypothetical protein
VYAPRNPRPVRIVAGRELVLEWLNCRLGRNPPPPGFASGQRVPAVVCPFEFGHADPPTGTYRQPLAETPILLLRSGLGGGMVSAPGAESRPPAGVPGALADLSSVDPLPSKNERCAVDRWEGGLTENREVNG